MSMNSQLARRFVDLEPSKLLPWMPDDMKFIRCRRSLPFVESKLGTYAHRVRSLDLYTVAGRSHFVATCWCGLHLCWDRKRRTSLLSEPSTDRFVCGTCEGRATGAGQLGAREIAGRVVMFRSRQEVWA